MDKAAELEARKQADRDARNNSGTDGVDNDASQADSEQDEGQPVPLRRPRKKRRKR